MGSCISKCMPGKNPRLGRDGYDDDDGDDLVLAYDDENVYGFIQEKLVISQAPAFKPAPPPLSNKISPLPTPGPSRSSSNLRSSSSSLFSTGGGSSSCTSSCSSLLSTASSAPSLSSKDRSFSNDFLLSCIKENPHVLNIKAGAVDPHPGLSSSQEKVCARRVGSPTRVQFMPSPARQPIPKKESLVLQGPTVQKRVRSSSPILTRQKCMRVAEPDPLASPHSLPSRVLRSPSPSRRFEGGDNKRKSTSASTRSVAYNNQDPKLIRPTSPMAVLRREHMRPPSPTNKPKMIRVQECLMMTRDQTEAKVEEIAVKFSNPLDNVTDTADDINNPLISLDCFIFL